MKTQMNGYGQLMAAEGEGTSAGGGSTAPAADAGGAGKPKKAKASKPTKAKAKPKAKAKGKGVTGPAVLKEYAPNYNKDKTKKTSGGNVSVDSNDALAKKLRGAELDTVYAEAVKVLNTNLEEGEKPHTVASLKAKYKHLNVGMQRMNLGNRMRGVLNAK